MSIPPRRISAKKRVPISDVSKSSFGGMMLTSFDGTMITIPLPLTMVVISWDGSDNPAAEPTD